MATPKLNTTTSIVDFLKSQGKESSFAARRQLFNEKGFNTRLGEFTGTASQNLALLRNLRGEQTPTATTPPSAGAGGTGAVSALDTAGTSGVPPSSLSIGALRIPTPGGGGTTPDGGGVARDTTGAASFTEQISQRTGVQPPTGVQPGGQFDLTPIPEIKPPSSADILARARGETGVQISEEEKRIGKERIQAQLEGQLKDIRSNFASRGLVFSGAVTEEQKAARDQALADELDLDIRFSKILGSAIDRAQNELGREIEDVIQNAKQNRKEDIDFLASVGLAVDPRTGQLFPTLAAQREERIANFEQSRFELSQAKEAFDQAVSLDQRRIAQENLELATAKAMASAASAPATGQDAAEIDTLARLFINGEGLGAIGASKKARVVQRAEEIQREQALLTRKPTSVEIEAMVTALKDEGFSDAELIDGLTEDFGFSRITSTRLVQLVFGQEKTPR